MIYIFLKKIGFFLTNIVETVERKNVLNKS